MATEPRKFFTVSRMGCSKKQNGGVAMVGIRDRGQRFKCDCHNHFTVDAGGKIGLVLPERWKKK